MVRSFFFVLQAIIFLSVQDCDARIKRKQSSLLIDVSNSKILYANNATAKIHPASLTKLMTLYILFDKIKHGQIKLTDKVVFSKKATRQVPSKLAVKAGDSINIRQSIYALVVKSANDAAYAIAEKCAGNEKKFAEMMNKYAKKLNMRDTHFVNASGLHNKKQYTTSMDLFKLSRAILVSFPEEFHYFSKKGFSHNGSYHRNHNKLLGFSKSAFLVNGMKTGFTNASGYNIVASASKGKTRLIAIVLGSNSAKERDATVNKLFKYGFYKTTARPRAKFVSFKKRKKVTKRIHLKKARIPKDSILILLNRAEKNLQRRRH